MASNKKPDLESQTHTPSASAVVVPAPAAAQETQPLLVVAQSSGSDEATRLQRAMTQAFRSTADLAKHLPTGAVLVFAAASPVFTNGGQCSDVNRIMTACLVGLCAAACFFLCFTDSFIDAKGTVRYVLATRTGLWVIDGTPPPPAPAIALYKLKFIDFLHAVLSVMVFMSVAVFDKNVGSCFLPVLSKDMKQVLTAVPLAGGIVGAALFAVFPSRRHGIGFPIPGVSS